MTVRGGSSSENEWKIVKGKKTNKIKTQVTEYCNIANTTSFSPLQQITSTSSPPTSETALTTITSVRTKKKKNTPSRKHVQHTLRLLAQQESAFLERSITRAENERTEMAKQDTNSPVQQAIKANHSIIKHQVPWTKLSSKLQQRS